MDIAIMIEGQNGVTWEQWQRIAHTVEELGFAGLYRSDHFTNANPPPQDSLELWTSLTWLASHTERIDFGPLVTPPSFRHPVFTARYGLAVDDLSGGRLHLGLGAGWQEYEHNMFGFPLLELGPRFERFEEMLDVITALTQSDEPVSYEGDYYTLNEAILLPRPQRPGGPNILVGGNGRNRTLRLAAQHASMWNGVYTDAATFKELNEILDGYMEEEGRDPGDIHRSIMIGCTFAPDEDALQAKVDARGTTTEKLRERGVIVATPVNVLEQLAEFDEAGAERVMLQWLPLEDMDGLHLLAETVLAEYPSAPA